MLNNVVGLLGGAAPEVGDYESIQTYTVGSGGQTNITFTSIPATYKHLQIRGIARRNVAQAYADNILYEFNSDTTVTNYYRHNLIGDGSAVANSLNSKPAITLPGNSQTANSFGAFVIDILDYADTNKYKTVRALTGVEDNTTNTEIRFTSGLWKNTAAINNITFLGNPSFVQYSTFALYGIK
jgi:hypothetical protein